jgi:hypothetical protein
MNGESCSVRAMIQQVLDIISWFIACVVRSFMIHTHAHWHTYDSVPKEGTCSASQALQAARRSWTSHSVFKAVVNTHIALITNTIQGSNRKSHKEGQEYPRNHKEFGNSSIFLTGLLHHCALAIIRYMVGNRTACIHLFIYLCHSHSQLIWPRSCYTAMSLHHYSPCVASKT